MQEIQSPYKELLDRILYELKGFFKVNLVSVVLYGSVARGDFGGGSDIDILIVCEDLPGERLKRQHIFTEIEKEIQDEFKCLIMPILRTREEVAKISPLYLDMIDDAIILYDKDNFFKDILRRLREDLEKIGAEKVYIGKKWYWDLKPDYKEGDVVKIGYSEDG